MSCRVCGRRCAQRLGDLTMTSAPPNMKIPVIRPVCAHCWRDWMRIHNLTKQMTVSSEMTLVKPHIRLLEARDTRPIAHAFHLLGWNKPIAQYQRYLLEQKSGHRTVYVAYIDRDFAGYLTINWHTDYPPFRAANIPEIQDFNVLPQFRRRGIGTRLMDAAEQKIAERVPIAGIGVG